MGMLMPPFLSFYLLYILLITVSSIPMFINSATLKSDIQVLRDLKSWVDPNSIPPGSYLSSWEFTSDPCESTGGQFLGILCSFPLDNSPNRIIALELDPSGYDGFITQSIGNLTELTTINLNRNHFRGPIPNSITNLEKLTRFSMSNNFLTGDIPTGLGTLKMLESLDLSFNALSGSIPSSIGGLRSLKSISMSVNALSGRIPDLTGLWQLRTLDLSRNQLYGDFPNVPFSLRTLILSNNLLSGHILSLNKLRNLQLLDVSYNRLSGRISRDIFTLPKLILANLSINGFTTLEVARILGSETRLQVFDAQRNHLRGNLPLNLVTLLNLTTINLSYNQLYGHIPEEFGARVGAPWKTLYLDHNFLQGRLPGGFIKSSEKIKATLSGNCLRCPESLPMCYGGQRRPSECRGWYDESG